MTDADNKKRYETNVQRMHALQVLLDNDSVLRLSDCDPADENGPDGDQIRIALGCQYTVVKYREIPTIIAALQEAMTWESDS